MLPNITEAYLKKILDCGGDKNKIIEIINDIYQEWYDWRLESQEYNY